MGSTCCRGGSCGQDHEASLLRIGERKAIFSRANDAGLYYAAKQYSRRSGMEERDDVHEADRSVHQRTSFASNRFTSSGIDDISQDSESDSGVELEYYKYEKEEASQRSSHGFMKIISSMFRLRSSKRSLTDTTQEGTSFDDSDSETDPPPEMETVEFMTDSCLEATSTISESTDGGSNASNLGSEEENENEDNESSDEEEDDDLFEDGLFNDYDDGWNDRMVNCLCTCK